MVDSYVLVVSEPWDYQGTEGSNIIHGSLAKVLSPKLVIFRSNQLLTFGDLKGQFLVLKPRYVDQELTSENAYEGTVGGALLLSENLDAQEADYFEQHSKYVLIGSLRREG